MSLLTTTREQGTNVHTARTINDFITACEDVVQNGYAKVNGHCMDGTTASMVCQVWAKLNVDNKAIIERYWNKWSEAKGLDGAVSKVVNVFWKCCQ